MIWPLPILLDVSEEEEQIEIARKKAGKRVNEARLAAETRAQELKEQAARTEAVAKAAREKAEKKEKALLEKEAKKLPKNEREVFLSSRKGVFCEECGNMNTVIRLSREKIARFCMAHDRGIIAKYNPELLRPEKAKKKRPFEY